MLHLERLQNRWWVISSGSSITRIYHLLRTTVLKPWDPNMTRESLPTRGAGPWNLYFNRFLGWFWYGWWEEHALRKSALGLRWPSGWEMVGNKVSEGPSTAPGSRLHASGARRTSLSTVRITLKRVTPEWRLIMGRVAGHISSTVPIRSRQ